MPNTVAGCFEHAQTDMAPHLERPVPRSQATLLMDQHLPEQ
jgi:hypothetical protein